jgi:hypothetical protein
MDTTAVVKKAEAEIALAKLAESMRPAESCSIRRLAGDTSGMICQREVVLTFANEAHARAFYDAAMKAAGKIA